MPCPDDCDSFDPPAWHAQAACLGMGTEPFFPIGVTGLAFDAVERARAVCARCTVPSACLEWALQTRQAAGIWGGLTEDERRALRRRR